MPRDAAPRHGRKNGLIADDEYERHRCAIRGMPGRAQASDDRDERDLLAQLSAR